MIDERHHYHHRQKRQSVHPIELAEVMPVPVRCRRKRPINGGYSHAGWVFPARFRYASNKRGVRLPALRPSHDWSSVRSSCLPDQLKVGAAADADHCPNHWWVHLKRLAMVYELALVPDQPVAGSRAITHSSVYAPPLADRSVARHQSTQLYCHAHHVSAHTSVKIRVPAIADKEVPYPANNPAKKRASLLDSEHCQHPASVHPSRFPVT